MKPLLQIANLKKHFSSQKGRTVRAVDDVSFSVNRGEVFGLVGESGSGKTTLGRTILRLVEPDSGHIFFDGTDITRVRMRPWRRKMQIIFQNPADSLNPKMRVREILAEAFTAGGCREKGEAMTQKVAAQLELVGLQKDDMYRYPSAFSGGQQQRITIARALAVDPQLLVCDEPVSALDVSYQAQIINLLEDLKQQKQLTYLFISHDLSVVMHLCDRIGVMFHGKLVEIGTREDILLHPAHPYTRELMAAVPGASKWQDLSLDDFPEESVSIDGGCRYRLRCPLADTCCRDEVLREISPGHFCACCKG